MRTHRQYIPSPRVLKEMYWNPSLNGMYKTVDKVSLDKIKIEPSLFAFRNELDKQEVERIVKHFYRGAWFPVMINQHGYLLDGQHRLAAAKELGLRYIDAVVQVDDHRKPNKRKKDG